jgi:transcription initiation factor IIF auxiliary subunit
MGFRLNNSIIRDPDGRIKFKRLKEGGYDHYHVGVWLEADDERDLERVEWVEYELHPSFRNRVRTSHNRANDFSITFWSWGTFHIQAKVHLAGADTVTVERELNYDLPADTGSNYVQVSG